MTEIETAEYFGRPVRLRPGVVPVIDDPEEWYDCYGAHISWEDDDGEGGQVEIQAVDYDWLDDPDDGRIIRRHLADFSGPRWAAEDLVAHARAIRDAAEGVIGLLEEAVEAYERDDIHAVVRALEAAHSAETDHGDDPATARLVAQILIPADGGDAEDL